MCRMMAASRRSSPACARVEKGTFLELRSGLVVARPSLEQAKEPQCVRRPAMIVGLFKNGHEWVDTAFDGLVCQRSLGLRLN